MRVLYTGTWNVGENEGEVCEYCGLIEEYHGNIKLSAGDIVSPLE